MRKLETFAVLDEAQRTGLYALCNNVRLVPAKMDIVTDGDRPEWLHLIVRGWAARYKNVGDGNQQITAFVLPGDFLDAHVTILGCMDHSVRALTRCEVAFIKAEALDDLTSADNGLARAFWWATLVDEATLRSWITSIGSRDGYTRVAHLLCELHARLKLIGLAQDDSFELPLTQSDLGDATGLTPVHVNRMLQRLRADKLIKLSKKVLTVLDVAALQKAAGFDPSFLHITRRIR